MGGSSSSLPRDVWRCKLGLSAQEVVEDWAMFLCPGVVGLEYDFFAQMVVRVGFKSLCPGVVGFRSLCQRVVKSDSMYAATAKIEPTEISLHGAVTTFRAAAAQR